MEPDIDLLRPLDAAQRERVGLLRGYGNAIVPQAAAEFIAAVFDVLNLWDRDQTP